MDQTTTNKVTLIYLAGGEILFKEFPNEDQAKLWVMDYACLSHGKAGSRPVAILQGEVTWRAPKPPSESVG